jgi:hypothetical protein
MPWSGCSAYNRANNISAYLLQVMSMETANGFLPSWVKHLGLRRNFELLLI